MANVHIPGECIKCKKDAEKCLKDHDASFLRDGWREHEAKRDAKDKECDDKIYDYLKSNSYGKYYGFKYKPGQYEAIFGKQESERREKTSEKHDQS